MDIKLFYRGSGSGMPLILLHGNNEDSFYFSHQISCFSKHYRVIALDTRGHGQSPRGTAPFTIRQFAEDLLDFMNEQHIHKAILCGFSDGGNIALTFALKHPERVEKLILNGANLYPQGVEPFFQIPTEIHYRIAKLYGKRHRRSAKEAEMLGLMVEEPYINPQALKRLTMQTLVIVGTRDMIKPRHTKLIYDHLPFAILVTIPGDHFIAKKNPATFNRVVQHFLEA